MTIRCLLRRDRPDLVFLFAQMQDWITVDETEANKVEVLADSQEVLLKSIKNLVDSVLVAMEKYHKEIIKLPVSTEDAGWLHNCCYFYTASTFLPRVDQDREDTVYTGDHDCWTLWIDSRLIPRRASTSQCG